MSMPDIVGWEVTTLFISAELMNTELQLKSKPSKREWHPNRFAINTSRFIRRFMRYNCSFFIIILSGSISISISLEEHQLRFIQKSHRIYLTIFTLNLQKNTQPLKLIAQNAISISLIDMSVVLAPIVIITTQEEISVTVARSYSTQFSWLIQNVLFAQRNQN